MLSGFGVCVISIDPLPASASEKNGFVAGSNS
jgi:hypothetical protein